MLGCLELTKTIDSIIHRAGIKKVGCLFGLIGFDRKKSLQQWKFLVSIFRCHQLLRIGERFLPSMLLSQRNLFQREPVNEAYGQPLEGEREPRIQFLNCCLYLGVVRFSHHKGVAPISATLNTTNTRSGGHSEKVFFAHSNTQLIFSVLKGSPGRQSPSKNHKQRKNANLSMWNTATGCVASAISRTSHTSN